MARWHTNTSILGPRRDAAVREPERGPAVSLRWCVCGRARSCGRRLRVSPRRNSTSPRSEGGVHRRAPGVVRSSPICEVLPIPSSTCYRYNASHAAAENRSARARRDEGRRSAMPGRRARTTVPEEVALRPLDLVERDSRTTRPNELWEERVSRSGYLPRSTKPAQWNGCAVAGSASIRSCDTCARSAATASGEGRGTAA